MDDLTPAQLRFHGGSFKEASTCQVPQEMFFRALGSFIGDALIAMANAAEKDNGPVFKKHK